MPDWRITLSIDSSIKEVALLGVAVESLCVHAGFSKRTAKKITASIVEAANNVIKHAYGGAPGNLVEVVCERHEDHMAFLVRDHGMSMGALKIKELDFDPDDTENLPEGGMGLFIIQRIMDTVEYVSEHGANVLRMTRKFSEAKEKGKA